jgi:hypothetical protein
MTSLCTCLAVALAVALAAVQTVLAQDPPAAATKPATTKPATQASGPIDYNKLKEALPETLAGMKRTEATGERSGFGEMKFSTARATYAKNEDQPDAPRIDMQIIDYGTNKQMVDAMAMWTQMEVDQEGDQGYHRTLKIKEQPAMEQYVNEGKTGVLNLLVGGRFLVTVNTSNLPAEQFKKIGEELKVKELAALAK